MTSTQRRIARMSLKSCILAVTIFLTYQGGYALGRKRGKANHPITFGFLVTLITWGTAEEIEEASGNPFGDFSGDPFGDAK